MKRVYTLRLLKLVQAAPKINAGGGSSGSSSSEAAGGRGVVLVGDSRLLRPSCEASLGWGKVES